MGIKINIQSGDIVKIDKRFTKAGSQYGYVYEEYGDFSEDGEYGVSVITKDGNDLGGFSFAEKILYIQYVRHSGFIYDFTNVMRLSSDFSRGLFTKLFKGL